MRLVAALQCLLILVLMFGESEEIGTKTGPYDIDVEQIFLCEDQGAGLGKFNISLYLGRDPGPKFKKHLHRGSFSVTITEEEFHRAMLGAKFYQKKTNDFLLMYNYNAGLCDTVKGISSAVYKSLRKEVGLPEEGCVIPKGNYTFNDWEIPFGLPTPVLEYGTYKAFITFLLDKQIFGCVVIVIEVKRKY